MQILMLEKLHKFRKNNVLCVHAWVDGKFFVPLQP